MGEAFDRDSNLIGTATGSNKREVLKTLEEQYPDMVGARIRSMESESLNCGQSPLDSPLAQPMGNLERRIEVQIKRMREQSAASSNLYYQANQLQAFLNCLPRQLDLVAAEGLNYILRRAGF